MGDYATVKVEVQGPVAIVSLNRPDKLNAFDTALRTDLLKAVNEVNADDKVRIAVLTGEGRAFCAGADLSEQHSEDRSVENVLNTQYKPILMAISTAAKPWISAVAGPAAGIGSAFAMVCDLTVMADDAYIYQAFTAIGLIPDGGATWQLARTLGRKRAYELIVSGEKLAAGRCLELGLCNRVVPAGEATAEAISWASALADKAPLALRYAKQSLSQAMEAPLDSVISGEAQLQEICVNSEDAKEGVAAFMEKRAAKFAGR